jgi:aminopeptidase N
LQGGCGYKDDGGVFGRGCFVDGVKWYSKKPAYANAKMSDLWEALSFVSGKDFGALMEAWTKHIR